MISRRDLLKTGVGFTAMTLSGLDLSARAVAAPASDTRLMVVFLRGAYDAISVVVPFRSDFYYESRPDIAIHQPDPANPLAAMPLDNDWALHPALGDSLYPLWKRGQMALIPFAGTDDVSRSHFDTQDAIELGQPIDSKRDYNSGFLGRLVGAMGERLHPISFTQDVPVIFRGGTDPVPNLVINAIGKPAYDARQQGLITGMYHSATGEAIAPLVGVETGFSMRQQAYDAFRDEMTESGRGAINANGFVEQARHMAQLMKQGYNLAFVDVGGWDTHVNQGSGEGDLARKVGDLGRGLAGFAEACGDDWSRTTVVVISEFGRTFRENGDKGTDHGHGSIYWVLGGNVKGGRMAGPQVKLSPETLFQKRDLPVLTDYRALLGGLVQRLYGLDSAAMERVFPSVKPQDLGLV